MKTGVVMTSILITLVQQSLETHILQSEAKIMSGFILDRVYIMPLKMSFLEAGGSGVTHTSRKYDQYT